MHLGGSAGDPSAEANAGALNHRYGRSRSRSEAADKYVTVVTASGEALVRMSVRELATRLDGLDLVQVHRGVMVNASCMTTAARNELGHLSLRLRGLAREVKVSRAFAHLFRPM